MQTTTPTAPQDYDDTDLVGLFKNLGQRFQNALNDKNEDTMKTVRFIQREIDRLRVEKSEPDAPKQFILEAIAANEARFKLFDAELMRVELIKIKLIEDATKLIEDAIRRLVKPPEEEESKEPAQPHQKVIQMESELHASVQEIDAPKQVIAGLQAIDNTSA